MEKLLLKFFYQFSRLPWGVLYGLSDLLYYILRLSGYRHKIVWNNLKSAFPEKDEQELKHIDRGFYHFLCDYFVETLKLWSMTDEEVLQHIEFRGAEQIEQCFSEGQPCAAILGHYCNWEYLSASPLSFVHHKDAVAGLIYHKLRNSFFNALFLHIREAHHGVGIPKQDILRYLFRYKQEGRMSLMGYIADQAPKWSNIHLWLPFLNHKTPVFSGAERIMRKMDNAVFYVDMDCDRRGHYICTFQLITRTPNELPEYEITRRFFQLLEDNIRRRPKYYLWSHNRWKRTYEEYLIRKANNVK